MFEQVNPVAKKANRILGNTSKKINKKYSIYTVADAVSVPGGELRMLGLDFQKHGEISNEEIEEILFDAAYDILEQVNNSQDIRSNMIRYPFTLNEIDVSIFLKNEDGSRKFHPEVMSVGLTKGKFYYLTRYANKKGGEYPKKYPASESKYYRGEK